MILETLLSGLGGGLLRLLPEALKFFDRKNERKHELDMLTSEMEFAKIRGEQEMRRTEATISVAELDGIAAAVKEQGETARSAGWFAALISSMVRPIVTYAFVGMYFAVKVAGMSLAKAQGAMWERVLQESWTYDDMQILSMILGFWFVSRSVEKRIGKA